MSHLAPLCSTTRFVEYPWVWAALGTQPRRVLDLGCADSMLAVMLASLGHDVVAVDKRDYPYRHPRLEFIRGDVFDVGVRRRIEKVDTVVMVSVLEHFGAKPGEDVRLLKQLDDIINPGGNILATFPCGRSQLVGRVEGGDPWFRIYSARDIEDMAEESGWAIAEQTYYEKKISGYQRISADRASVLASPPIALYAWSAACVKLMR